MDSQIKIGIVCCYIGKLPWYFDYFVLSCKYNPTVDFFLVVDDKSCAERKVPENIKFIYTSLREINILASQKLGFETNIVDSYKLCDFKPVYGLLFSEILTGYHFWGHGDIDLVFGNIRYFITDEILINHDVIAVRDDFLTGYFLLFRNNEQLVSLFTHSKDYKRVLSSSGHYCFDETNFHFKEFERKMNYAQVKSEIESMTHVVKKLSENGVIKSYFDFHVIEGAYGKLKWTKGKLLYKNKYEAVLYHLIKFKNIYREKNNLLKKDRDLISFKISPTKIYDKKWSLNR
ncbi:MAG: hypothetical protein JST75_20495 [Bacteroidetes bacterium]|nr:hypothetical protein [Bacteroidota bacterium]